MNNIPIVLDINNPSVNYIPPFSPVVGDSNSYQLNISLVNNGVAYNLTGCTVDISIGKTDYTTTFKQMNIVSTTAGQISYVLTTNDIAAPGETVVEIIVYGSSSAKLTTVRFSFTVREGILNDESIESTNDYSALTDVLAQINAATGNAGTAANLNTELQNDINTGNTLHSSLQGDINTGNSLHTELQSDIGTANSTKTSLDQSISNGNLSNYVLSSFLNSLLVGMVTPFPCNTPPSGWLEAKGQLVSRTSYPNLWNFANNSNNIFADGSQDKGQFSTGDGSTTFRLPDMRGYFVRGFDDGASIDSGRTLGSSQADTLASHYHGIVVGQLNHLGGGTNYVPYQGNSSDDGGLTTTSTGGTETRPKNVALMYCIKY